MSVVDEKGREAKCEICLYFESHGDGSYGQCLRSPPVFIGDIGTRFHEREKWSQPYVYPETKCGEFVDAARAVDTD